jgi:hypothetical protein
VLRCTEKIARQDDVTVDETYEIVPRQLLCLREEVVDQWRAVLVLRDFGNMPNAKLPGSFGRASFIAKNEDLGIRMQAQPTQDGVALNHADMADEGFRHCKNCQHREKWNVD